MSEVEWLSMFTNIFHLTSKLLNKLLEAKQQLEDVKKELERLKDKLQSLEHEYGYDTVN